MIILELVVILYLITVCYAKRLFGGAAWAIPARIGVGNKDQSAF